MPEIILIASMLLAAEPQVFHAHGEMAGEVTPTSVILQSRLTATQKLTDGDVPGTVGAACFELSEHDDFRQSRTTGWLKADAENDFIIKVRVDDLTSATRYYYRLIYGADQNAVQTGETCSFRTLQGSDGTDEVSFVVVTGMNYMSFHYGKVKNGKRTGVGAYQRDDKQLGFPALATIAKMKPDFFVGTGDNVYYDSHDDQEATELKDLRRKWHEQFVQPRFVELFRNVPTYWEKDDHDHRYNDCDCEGNRAPLSDLGIRTFREQVPVVDPLDPEAKTYRTHRVNRHLQIWLVEGRDYRSLNKMPDGPDKTLWGAEQIGWLKRTLLESDATWKLLISPTPMIGPDDAYKIDNHTNHKGFRREGRAFFDWIKAQQLDRKGFHVICGDRHWQYHSIDSTGIEELSSGALVDSNSRLGRDPGDPKSTDPEAKIKQLYSQTIASGGFLKVSVAKDGSIRFEFFDEHGESLYHTVKRSPDSLSVLKEDGAGLLRDYLQRRIHEQYDARRRDVEQTFSSPTSLRKRQAALRQHLRTIIGELPQKSPLNAKTTGTLKGNGFLVEKVVFQSRPQHYVTASLYIPRGDGPFPGVLIACGHSGHGKAYSYYQKAAMLMARSGMMALVYDCIGQGERLSYLQGSSNVALQHKRDNVNAVLVGRTAVGYQAWDGVRAADYLLSRPEVDQSKPLGMTGNSGGGAQTMYLMALDERIGPAAPSCHITTLERNFELGGAGDGCQSSPLTGALGIDHADFFVMRAPRPSIILSAERDYKDIVFTRKTYTETQKAYALLDRSECMQMFVYNDTHSFSQPRREAAAQWMQRWLLGKSDAIQEPELVPFERKELQVTESGQVLREFSGALSVSDLNLLRAKKLTSARRNFWQSRNTDEALKKICELSGVEETVPAAKIERRGVINRGDYQIEKLILRREGEIPVPALLARRSQEGGKSHPVLYVDGRGKATDAGPGGAIEELVRSGHTVLSIDLRGFGETTDSVSKVVYVKGDHRTAMWSLHLGKPLLGQRLEDVLAALSCFPFLVSAHRAVEIDLIGVGRAGPIVLHAASLSDHVGRVTIRNSIQSWVDDVVARPLDIHAISHVIPSALATYDLPDLARLLGDRLTVE
ncbi:MAG: hypothetical protein GY758_08035 [Fuerstiella sp.]|nr:hypothetical protein [Fuerstiella sp.]MCP4513099.1 hypothetical protein [Fuerstiella sp.]MCP4855594.1 hypothetical protein [Fuerstiella sp.]